MSSSRATLDEFVRSYLKDGYGYYTEENAKFSELLNQSRAHNDRAGADQSKSSDSLTSKNLANRVTSAFEVKNKPSAPWTGYRTNSRSSTRRLKKTLFHERERKLIQQEQFSRLKTTQIVYETDKTGHRKAKLKEPRNLYSIDQEFSDENGPVIRYPSDFKVLRANLNQSLFNSKRPSSPEPLYERTGTELKPRVGQPGGRLIYWCDNGDTHVCFKKSCIGGKPAPPDGARLTAVFYNDMRQKLDMIKKGYIERSFLTAPLLFESRFEAGNVKRVTRVEEYSYEIELRSDLYAAPTQWYLFRVENAVPGQQYRFTIVNLYKKSSLYNLGMKPLMYTEQTGWVREGDNVCYYKNVPLRSSQSAASCANSSVLPTEIQSKESLGSEDTDTEVRDVRTRFDGLYSLTWTWKAPIPTGDFYPNKHLQIYFAHCYPYMYSDLKRYLFRNLKSKYAKIRLASQSLASNPIYMITITEHNPTTVGTKPAIVLSARVHPGESNSSWIMKGVLDFLTDEEDPIAKELRERYVFKIIPMINVDGVVVGNYRCSLTGRDMNRNYRTIISDSFPPIYSIKRLLKRLNTPPRQILLYTDFHGHNRKNNIFIYGCTPTDAHKKDSKPMPKQAKSCRFSERVFPFLLQKRVPELFSIDDCKFKIQKSKEGTGRIVAWRTGIVNAYTLESSFAGSTLGDRKGTHIGLTDLETMGRRFCQALYDYGNKEVYGEALHCIQEQTRKRVVDRVIGSETKPDGGLDDDLYDRLMDSVDIDHVDSSDIESETDGSDSSEDDGMPLGSEQRENSNTKSANDAATKEAPQWQTESEHEIRQGHRHSIAFEKVSATLNDSMHKPEKSVYKRSTRSRKPRIVRSTTPLYRGHHRQELRMSKVERVSSLNDKYSINEFVNSDLVEQLRAANYRPVSGRRLIDIAHPKTSHTSLDQKQSSTFRTPALLKAEDLIPEGPYNIAQLNSLYVPRTLGNVRSAQNTYIQNQLDAMKADIDRGPSIHLPIHTNAAGKQLANEIAKMQKREVSRKKPGGSSVQPETVTVTLSPERSNEIKFYSEYRDEPRIHVDRKPKIMSYYSASPVLYKPDFPTRNSNSQVNNGSKHHYRHSLAGANHANGMPGRVLWRSPSNTASQNLNSTPFPTEYRTEMRGSQPRNLPDIESTTNMNFQGSPQNVAN